MPKRKILIIDDEPGSIEAFRIILKDDYEILSTNSAAEGLRIIARDDVQLVLLDIVMPEMDGIEVLRKIRERDNSLTVIMVTATKSIKTAVEAMKLGAFDYLSKPFEVNEAKLIVSKAMQSRALLQELEYLRAELKQRYGIGNIIGKSKAIKEVFQTLNKVAPTKSTVLITGESGTGKELIAQAIHFTSPRKDKPIVVVQCAAIPETLMESELFGHEKGSFTDATSRKLGKFELADEGTLFLDEIGEMSPAVQAKILRALEEQEITRVGGTKLVSVDIRLIAATNLDLKKAVAEGTFRKDLYYRINVVPIALAPLRERKEDIALLANYFLDKHGKEINPKVKEISLEALEALTNYSWPGNIRELENIIERILTLTSRSRVLPEDLPRDIREPGSQDTAAGSVASEGLPLSEAVERLEKEMILKAIEKTSGMLSETAKQLGVTRRVLSYKMESLGIKGKNSTKL
ncbi:MAG: sigma-54 dependent transcriptional regulator [Omnitrophica bacterium]|nr:sigma-54 dependent transcriptional regulator [Candidatus Omnitrophota bacterium]